MSDSLAARLLTQSFRQQVRDQLNADRREPFMVVGTEAVSVEDFLEAIELALARRPQ